ncbi:catalase related subgroup [Auriculariales sp. MPI-PUGE-AT-0066]|nr:catalase related subgroup [Auriculariales sp. MPI-PUGE-AT-0066]
MPLPSDKRVVALSDKIVKTLDKVFGGEHPGHRAAHARGVLLSGSFAPTPAAAQLSTVPHFNTPSTVVTARFSSSTGLPKIPDTDPNAEPRGFAVRFELAPHKHTDIVAHSTNAFPTRTADEFLEFFEAVISAQAGGPPVSDFVSARPSVVKFVTTPKPTPASFGTEAYFALSAFKFTNASGVSRYGRYTWQPVAGLAHLTPEERDARGESFLFEEIEERVSKGPVKFELSLQLANEGDATDDVTLHWPEDRERVVLGTLSLDKIVPENAKEQKHIIFDPIPRIDGIEPSADPLFEVRAAVYLISGRRRRAAPLAE